MMLVALVFPSVGLACVRPPLGTGTGSSPSDGAAGNSDAGFLAVSPCHQQSDYTVGTTTISFGFFGPPSGFAYEPKCLKIAAGVTVTFSGDFRAHPLYPSRTRGAVDTNPIPGVAAGSSREVEFRDPGFFAYYCGIHGAIDDGLAMAGTIWVE